MNKEPLTYHSFAVLIIVVMLSQLGIALPVTAVADDQASVLPFVVLSAGVVVEAKAHVPPLVNAISPTILDFDDRRRSSTVRLPRADVATSSGTADSTGMENHTMAPAISTVAGIVMQALFILVQCCLRSVAGRKIDLFSGMKRFVLHCTSSSVIAAPPTTSQGYTSHIGPGRTSRSPSPVLDISQAHATTVWTAPVKGISSPPPALVQDNLQTRYQ
ncbi:hypothetical protein C0995_009928 [Termitomyces sp. Mi166|nr:hypothetical protein C0995_009928 [Termitomyces sp. Mi166\